MEFRTAYGEKLKTKSPTGEKIEYRHRPEMGADGRRVLIRDKAVAIYDLIQASREECEIENIIRRATMGDANALNAKNPIYADITGVPKSIAEAQQIVINLKEEFDKLPKDVKAKFENNAEIYVAEFGTSEWAEKTGKLKEAIERAEKMKERTTMYENLSKSVEKIASGDVVIQKGDNAE